MKMTFCYLLLPLCSLLVSCVDVNASLESGELLLVNAVREENVAEVRRLLESGADPNQQEERRGYYVKTSPLSQALRKDNMEIVQVLLDAGARVEPEDVLSAARSGYPQYLRAVLDAGGEVPRCDGDSRKSPVWNELGGYGDDSVGEDVVACARLLEERGISLQDPAYARQPLHSAALFGRATLAAYLIERGCDVNERKSGKTPLMLNSHSEKIARLLLEHGADVNAQDDDGRTALMHESLDLPVARVLLAAGANPNLRNKKGETALLFQMRHPRSTGGCITNDKGEITGMWDGEAMPVELLQALIDAGADVNMPDKEGNTPMMELRIDEREITGMLRKAGAR